MFSTWDIQILLGRGGQLLGDTKVEEVATVYLSPSSAKALMNLLTRQIRAYEERHGPIKVPERSQDNKPKDEPKPGP